MDNKEEKTEISKQEEKVQRFWEENKIFEKSLHLPKELAHNASAERSMGDAGVEDFIFYDGPPFATGLPHYGHILAGVIKDAVPRYQTMRGRSVPRKWGWDCHGLPVENLIEKKLGLSSKKDIEKFGIEKFNKEAEKSVFEYEDDWRKIVPRLGRWVDMEDDYKTMDWSYTESVWWVFKTLYDKGLVYEGHKSMHICPRCETTLSNFEVAQEYKDIKDISVTAKFELEDEPGTFVLAWTTTPWTLPGNVALAVGEDIDYVKIKNIPEIKKIEDNNTSVYEREYYFISKEVFDNKKEAITSSEGEDTYFFLGAKVKETKEVIKGKDLIGKSYKPLFDYYSKDNSPAGELENSENGWKIYDADFVTTEDGTGVVHIAPAFGEDDMNLGKEKKLPFIQHVGMDGKMKEEVKDFAGLQVKPKDSHQSTDIEIIKYLAHNNKLFAKEKIEHSYPHCWRCDTPLLNYAANSWFIKVSDIKEGENGLIENNQKINWIPKHIKDGRFGKTLLSAPDWAVSRSRYWGAGLPIWKCEKCGEVKAIGSIDEIREGIGDPNKLFLIRHGEAGNNVEKILNSIPEKKEFHLTNNGKKQVEEVAKILKQEKIDMIFSSPVMRTKETAGILSKGLGIEIVFDERLRETGFGDFNGEPYEKFHECYPTRESRAEATDYGVESCKQVQDRLQSFLNSINKKYKGKNIIVVSHADPLQTLYGSSQELDLADLLKGWYPTYASPKITYSKKIDLHRPYIDNVVLECTSISSGQACGAKMNRIPEVFDCWFESGSMPYGQVHYPFDLGSRHHVNLPRRHNMTAMPMPKNFPAEFIAEGIDQTRGWFYTLLVLSTALFGKIPFNNVVVNGIILAEDGQKMSKRLKNYPDPMDVVNKYGADSLRLYLLSSPAVRGESLNFSEKGVDEVYKKVVMKLLNTYKFFEMYSGDLIDKEKKANNVLDKWILAKLKVLNKEVSESMDRYELDKATRPIGDFVDDLSNWYVRRSRDRFKGVGEDAEEAVLMTKYALMEFSKIISPFMPFVAEKVFKHLSPKESVHLEKWTEVEEISKDEEKILEQMEEVRKIVTLALEERTKAGIKVRQPLNKLKVKNDKLKGSDDFIQLIKDEVNVGEVVFDKKIKEEIKLDFEMTPELIKEGMIRELVRKIQDLRKKSGLVPQDKICLTIETDKEGKNFIKQAEDDIKSSTGTKKLKLSKTGGGDEMKLGDIVLKIELKKD